MKKAIYYAHPVNIYNTEQEKRDLYTIQSLFPVKEILNPNTQVIQKDIEILKKTDGHIMSYFYNLISTKCDVLVFRATPYMSITGGVWGEIQTAKDCGFPIIELPNLMSFRELSHEQTVEYLKLIGNR